MIAQVNCACPVVPLPSRGACWGPHGLPQTRDSGAADCQLVLWVIQEATLAAYGDVSVCLVVVGRQLRAALVNQKVLQGCVLEHVGASAQLHTSETSL